MLQAFLRRTSITIVSLEGFEPTCIQLAFLRFRKTRAYNDMQKCARNDCEKKTTNAKYCSRHCAAAVNNSLNPKRIAKLRQCKCGAIIHLTKESYSLSCSCCREQRQRKRQYQRDEIGTRTLEYYCNKNQQNHPSWKFAEVRSHCRRLHAHLRTQCQICGYDNHVELAHIIALNQWPLSAILNDVNSETNILVLCPNHHWEFDHGLIKLESIPIRNSSPL